MVKPGADISRKPGKERRGGDDAPDNVPSLIPLDASRLQQPCPDLTIVKTRTDYKLQQRKLDVPGSQKLNVNLYDEVAEKLKHKHCSPAVLEMSYSEQEAAPPGSLYMAIHPLSQGRKSIPHQPSPWMPAVGSLKEVENVQAVAGGPRE